MGSRDDARTGQVPSLDFSALAEAKEAKVSGSASEKRTAQQAAVYEVVPAAGVKAARAMMNDEVAFHSPTSAVAGQRLKVSIKAQQVNMLRRTGSFGGSLTRSNSMASLESLGDNPPSPIPADDAPPGGTKLPMLNLQPTPEMHLREWREEGRGGGGGAKTERGVPWKHVERKVDMITKGWGHHGAFIHNLQRQRYKNLKEECETTIEEQRAALCRNDVKMLEKPPSLNLSLDSPPRDTAARKVGSQHADGSHTERLLRGKASMGIHRVLNDRAARQSWLSETETLLGKEGSLAPYSIEPPPKYVPVDLLPSDQVDEEVVTIRSESKRIRDALHVVNCSMRKGSRFSNLSGEERASEMKSMQSDIRRLKHTTTRVVDSIGSDKEELMYPPRYDFVRANRRMLHLSDPRVKVAKAIRQSVLKMESMERIVQQVGAVEMERCNHIGSAMLERNKKVQQRLRDQDPRYLRKVQTQTEWCMAVFAARACQEMWEPIYLARVRLKFAALLVQRHWRGFMVRNSIANQRVLSGLKLTMPKLAQQARERLFHRAADMVKPFLVELSKNLRVRKAIITFRKQTIYLQRIIKETLNGRRAIRVKLLAQFERVEKSLLSRMIREKMIAIQKEKQAGTEAGAASKRKKKEKDEHEVDWGKMQGELHRLVVSDNVKVDMVYELLKMKIKKFVIKRQTWKDDMALYKSSLHQTLLFRTNVMEILAGTELEHMVNNLEGLAGTNKGMRELVNNMNRKLPVKPEFKENVPDDKMKDLVRQCLSLCSSRNFSLRLLLGHQSSGPAVVQVPQYILNYVAVEQGSARSLNPRSQGPR